jgi:8-oxo-dGTP diphosphatase
MDKNKKRVRVVAALIERSDGRVLITQRRPQAFMPLKWEFPGGKVEPFETDHDALKRELHEELGIEVLVGEHFMSLLHEYPDFEIDFNVYRCTLCSGSLQTLGVLDFRWVPVSQLESFEFPPADLPTVKLLLGQ